MPDSKPGIMTRFSSRRTREGNRFDVRVLSPSAESFDAKKLPFELQYLFSVMPESEERVRALVERGYGIGIRSVRRAPEHVLRAVERIRDGSQMGVLEPWLSRLVLHEEVPVFTEDELYEQNERGINLFTEAHAILGERYEMIRLLIVDLEAHGIDDADREFLSRMNTAIRPLSAACLLHRIRADQGTVNVRLRRTLLKIVFFIGPLAHILELWVRGMGQLFAALADDVTRETADLITLKGSGYTNRQLWKQSQVFLPVLIIAAWLSLTVQGLIERGSLFTAGLLFGLAAVSFPLVRLLQTYARTRAAYADLAKRSKLPSGHLPSLSVLSFQEIRRSSMPFGFMIGIVVAPLLTGIAFVWFPEAVHNGWFLAVLASLDVFVALFYRGNMMAFDRVLFIRKMKAEHNKLAAGYESISR